MSFWDRFKRAEQRAEVRDSPLIVADDSGVLRMLGMARPDMPAVTPDSAMTVPAVAAAITFLPRALANLPLHLFLKDGDKTERDRSELAGVLNETCSEEWTSFSARKYFWTQVFSQPGRGLLWIERQGDRVVGLWPIDATATTVSRVNGRKLYRNGGQTYEAREVIDVPFLLKADQISTHAPLTMAAKTIQLTMAMGDYAASFFAGGGVPPLALQGPMPQGAEAVRRAQADIKRSIDGAKNSKEPIFPIPAGYELKPVGIDPDKGQMTEARKLQVEELARIWGLPPVFLQDLSKGTFSNTEQQDLFLVKHLISGWSKALEEEMTLKLFGHGQRKRWVEHNLDALARGDLKSRMEALARGIQTSQLTPDEARAFENRPPLPGGDKLYIQGATVPLADQGKLEVPSEPEA